LSRIAVTRLVSNVRQRSLAALLLAAIAGCGDDRLDVYPVSGKVLVQGKPAAGAEVIFYTQEEELRKPGVPIPKGEVAEDGSFSLTSYEPDDGAPAGEYAVTVVWNQVVVADPDPESRVERDRLNGRYADPETSGLTATVAEDDNELPPFELK